MCSYRSRRESPDPPAASRTTLVPPRCRYLFWNTSNGSSPVQKVQLFSRYSLPASPILFCRSTSPPGVDCWVQQSLTMEPVDDCGLFEILIWTLRAQMHPAGQSEAGPRLHILTRGNDLGLCFWNEEAITILHDAHITQCAHLLYDYGSPPW